MTVDICKKNILLYLFVLVIINSCNNNGSNCVRINSEDAKKYLNEFLKDSIHPCDNMVLIPNDEVAIKIAEPILFNIYGKNKIVNEKPYRISLIDNYWLIMGSLSKNTDGGVFEIVINAKDGKIIGVSHGK
ncbi:MAG TPA: YbbC/YhhH family protein [Bacteroidales bacterium]|nr:YbbC/YhhH family protein [Bacteroidales bacterium]